ncbi:MAG: pyridoxine 5'-phosphate synthase [Bacteroidales bacterium]|nr:pyridoxine 5'-phosphate synthase [Bacteroidales bacterium]NLK82134.1 pyridoxine 5'-phosphate synthase [Bacteroidales bacterium]
MTVLSVNINKIALIRNSRGGDIPNVLTVALDSERFGAQGITVHPRPDARHIRYSDVHELRNAISTELNVEGYPSDEFCKLIYDVKPAQVTLVPDPPEALTSDAGWDTCTHFDFLQKHVAKFQEYGVRVSIFVDPDLKMIESAKNIGAERIELYTEQYARMYVTDKYNAIAPYVEASKHAASLGLQVNAGHDLSLENLAFFYQSLPVLHEVSIGHALVSDALYFGLEKTIQAYSACLI